VTAEDLREQIALACRIVALEGYTDLTLGHVSARLPGERVIWIKRKGLALDEVEPDDVIPLDLDDPDALSRPEYHLESVMHVEVYRARADVCSVIHGHPTYATALGATGSDLLMLTHDAVLFHEGLGTYEDSAALVTTRLQAVRVAEALGERRAALLRNHGVVVAGEDVRWAVLAAATLERAIRFQSVAATLGTPSPIPDEAVLQLSPQKYQASFLDDYWPAWVRRVGRSRARRVEGA
jgi:L-fuculose-phosphate aldolase